MAEKTRYGISIRSWRGAIGGVHFYVDSWREGADAPVEGLTYQDSHPRRFEKIQIERTLDAAAADALNKKDDDSLLGRIYTYKRGDTTERYDTEKDAVADALTHIRDTWGYAGPVEIGADYYYENPTVMTVEDFEALGKRLEH